MALMAASCTFTRAIKHLKSIGIITISISLHSENAIKQIKHNICRLCLLEKYLIMFRPAGATLNQNSEFFTTCRHKQSELLGKVKFKK